MTRYLKALGLTLIAVAAFGAITAASASAEETETEKQANSHWFTAASYPAKITGTQDEVHKFQIGSLGNVSCEKTHFDGELAGKSHSVTIFPTFEGCTTEILGTKYPTTVTANGCWYTFTVHEKGTEGSNKEQTETNAKNSTVETEVEGKKVLTHYWHGDVHIKCPAGVNGIEIHVYQKTDPEHKEAPRCTFTVKPQTVGKIDYTVKTFSTPDLTVTPTESEVDVTKTSGTLLQCGTASQTSKYTGQATVEAFNEVGTKIGGGIE